MECCQRSSTSTPLPYRTVVTVVSIGVVRTINTIMVFSYLPRLVKSFGTSEVNVGYQVGLILAVFSIGWMLSFFFWGFVGDRFGRKRALLVALVGAMVTGLSFGFSTNFYWALCSRFLVGLFMGLTCLLKSILMLACDDTNRPLAISIYYSAWTLACLVGPSVASFLVFPVEQYPGVFKETSIFNKFKVLLPNLIVTALWVLMIPLAYHLLDSDGGELEASDESRRLIGGGKEKNDETMKLNSRSAYPLYTEEDDRELSNVERQKVMEDDFNENNQSSTENRGIWRSVVAVLLSTNFLCCVILSSVVDAIGMFLEETFPVFAATSKEYNGPALTISQIGIVFLGAAGILLPCQFLIIPKILNHMGGRGSLIFASVVLTITVPVIPLVADVHGDKAIVCASMVAMGVSLIMVNTNYVAIQILINTYTPSHILGIVYSIAGASDLVGRTVGPLIYGPLYSWSLTNVKGVEKNGTGALGFPLNQYFVFFVVGLSSLAIAVAAKLVLSKDSKEQDAQ